MAVLWLLLTSNKHVCGCPQTSRLLMNQSFGYIRWISLDKGGSMPSPRELSPAQAPHLPLLVIFRLVFALVGVLEPSQRPRMRFLFVASQDLT